MSGAIAGNQISQQTTHCPISLSGRRRDLPMCLFITLFLFGTSLRPCSHTSECYLNRVLAGHSKYGRWEARSRTHKSRENWVHPLISYLSMKTPHNCLGMNIYRIIIMIWIISLIWNAFVQYVSTTILRRQNLKKHIYLSKECSVQRLCHLLEKTFCYSYVLLQMIWDWVPNKLW